MMKLFNVAVWLTSGLVVVSTYFYGSQQNLQQPMPTHVHLNQTHMTVTPTTTTATANDSTTIRKLTPPEDFFFNSAPISFTHIPKCAGTSFVKQFSPSLHNQECYDAMRRPNAAHVVLFRSPRSHVQSQFLFCQKSDWGRRQIRGRGYPNTGDDQADFQTWLDHFLELNATNHGSGVDYNCIDPREVQTRHMSCARAPNPRANHYLPQSQPLDLNHSLANLEHVTLVGMADFYHETKCLLELRRSQRLPEDCTCSKAIHNNTDVHDTHGVPKHEAVFSKEIQDKIDALTMLDRQLFVAALKRFVADIDVAEGVAGQTFFCNRAKAASLLREHSAKRLGEGRIDGLV